MDNEVHAPVARRNTQSQRQQHLHTISGKRESLDVVVHVDNAQHHNDIRLTEIQGSGKIDGKVSTRMVADTDDDNMGELRTTAKRERL